MAPAPPAGHRQRYVGNKTKGGAVALNHMVDPCFFRGAETFFEIITHERECLVQVLSPEFEKSLRKLGTWVDVSAESRLPLFLLNEAKGFK